MYTLGEAVGYIRLEMGKFLEEAQQARQTTQQIESEFDKLGDASKKIEGIITKSFVAIGAAIAAGLGKAVDVGSQFEASMSQVAATMGMTSEDIANNSADFEKLSAAAKEMGETTKFSASQAADALNYLALAGYDAEQSISTLPTVLNLAAAGGMDLARASDMITDAASALGLSLDDMSLFADKMAKAAQSSNTSVEQLGDAILQIGGTARNLSGGVTELNTALGILANNGIKAAEGGTALRQIVLNLTAPTEKASKYIEELGLKVADAAGNVRPLNDIFRDLDEILQSKGITGSADKIKALSEIFDARQLKSVTALLNNYGESWDRLYEKIDNAEGAAAQMAVTMETNLKGALTILGSTAEGFGITVYESIEGSFKKAVQEATEQLKNLNNAFKSSEMQQALQKISDAISKAIVELSKFLSDVIPKLAEGLAELIDNFDKIVTLFSGLATTVGLAAAGMMLYKIQTDLVTQSLIAQEIATLAANAALLANPYTLVAVGIGVLVAALVNEYQQQQKNIEQLDKLNEKYYEQEDAVNQAAENYDKEIEKARELNNSRDEEINRVNELLSVIERNVDETGKIVQNQEMVKDAIDELNSIIPINIQYQNDQIISYDKLVQSSKLYCEQLKNEAILEARKEEYKAASVAYDTAIKERDAIRQNLQEASDNYQKYVKIKQAFDEGYFLRNAEVIREAEEAGMGYSEYVKSMVTTTRNALDSATDAYQKNEEIIRESAAVLENAEADIVRTQNEIYAEQLKTGQEVTGIYASESEARIGIAEIEAQKIAEINRRAHQDRVEEMQDNADDIIAEEDALEAALDDLEVQYNTGVIKTDEEYHQKRLELLENFHGEWSKKSSQWLKKELDYEQKQKDDAIKEEEKRLKEEKEEKERQQKEAERAAKEAQRQREQEIKEAENAAREKERIFKEETNKKIAELDRRKKREKEYTDEKYIDDLTALRDTLDKESELWQQLDDKIYDLEQKRIENNKKALEQQNKDAYEAIKERKEIETGYTNEQYLEDLKNFQKTLNAESDLFKQVGKEIINVEKQISKEQQEVADTAFKSWEKGFDSLKSQAENAYDEIIKKQENLENKLNNEIELYETKTKKVKNLTTGLWEDVEVKETSTKFLKDQTKELENYQKELEKLSSRGISEDLMQKILGMDDQSAKEYVQALSKMSDDSLKAYDQAYTDLKAKNKEFSEKFYADEVEAFKTEWGQKIEDYLQSLPEEAKTAAQELVSEFVKGISETDSKDKDNGFKDIFASFLGDFKENAENNLLFKNYGTKSMKELEQEIEKQTPDVIDICENTGKDAGKSLSNNFTQEMKKGTLQISEQSKLWGETIKNKVMPSLDEIQKKIDSLFSEPKNITINTDVRSSQKQDKSIFIQEPKITQSDIENAIRNCIPDGNVILRIDGDKFAQISRKQLNLLSQRSGNMRLKV